LDFFPDDFWLLFAQRWLMAFLLVVTRLSGLLAIGPVLGHPNVPRQVRVFLIVALGLIVAPTVLGSSAADKAAAWDANRDGQLSAAEVPDPLHEEFQRQLRDSRRDETLPVELFVITMPSPKTLVDYLWLAVGEFAVGFALGLGVLTILTAVQLAGHVIDFQTGLSLGQIFNPQFGASSISAEFLLSLGTTLYLVTGGHVLLVNALLQTYDAIPLGYAAVSVPAIELLTDLVQQSLVLALQMSAPVLITLTLVGYAMGVLGHTVTTINFIDVGIPVRILVGLLVFSLALVRLAELLAGAFPNVLEQLGRALA
jgi:flagellar biosynthesis protein FliR